MREVVWEVRMGGEMGKEGRKCAPEVSMHCSPLVGMGSGHTSISDSNRIPSESSCKEDLPGKISWVPTAYCLMFPLVCQPVHCFWQNHF
jgi:hypothetical protein